MGRGRTLEVVLDADDFSGAMAERYGYVNRALPDAELGGFVDALANRLASFEKHALVATKRFVDEATLPSDDVFPAAMKALGAGLAEHGARDRAARLMRDGLQTRADVELRLGAILSDLGRPKE